MTKYLLAHDLGTSGNKATLFTTDGELAKSVVYSYETYYKHGVWAEQNPEDWWDAICITTQEIIRGIETKNIVAVSFSGQMMGCLCVDRSGMPLRNSIIWADQRSTKEADLLKARIGDERFYKVTGHRISPSYGIEKLMWIKENETQIYKDTYKVLNAKDYIIFRLTNRFVTDYSDATGTCALDLNKLEWSPEIIGAAEIDASKFPDALSSISVVGEVTNKASLETGLKAGTPVVCGGGDGVCAAVGSGCINKGDTYAYVGSSSWIAYASERPLFDKGMRTFNWAHIVPNLITPCGTMQSAGGSYAWLKNEICTKELSDAEDIGLSPYSLMNMEAMKSPVGSNGLLFLPYLLGERTPWWNPDARGAFLGLKMEHKRSDVIRSVLEGVALNLNLILSIFREYTAIGSVTIIGGGAKGDVWTGIMADVFNSKVKIPNRLEEATSMGAAVTGGVGVGVFNSFDVISKFIKIEKVFEPNETNHEKYKKVMPVFEKSYHALSDIFQELKKVQ